MTDPETVTIEASPPQRLNRAGDRRGLDGARDPRWVEQIGSITTSEQARALQARKSFLARAKKAKTVELLRMLVLSETREDANL